MIIKRGMSVQGLQPFRQKGRSILAKCMTEDFCYETGRGWNQGSRGDWLLLIDGDLWDAVEDGQFRKIYKPTPSISINRRTQQEEGIP